MVELRIILENNVGFMPCVDRTMTNKNCRYATQVLWV